jgi:hypothetical protein
MKWHRAVKQFGVQKSQLFWTPNGARLKARGHSGPKKSRFPWPNPLPLALVMDLPTSKALRTGPYKSLVHTAEPDTALEFGENIMAEFSAAGVHYLIIILNSFPELNFLFITDGAAFVRHAGTGPYFMYHQVNRGTKIEENILNFHVLEWAVPLTVPLSAYMAMNGS